VKSTTHPAARRRLVPGLLLVLAALTASAAEPDFAAGLTGLEALLAADKAADVLPAGRRLLRQQGGQATAADRSRAYALMFEAARASRDLRGGNLLAADVAKAERRRLGPDSPERVPGLLEIARWYAWADRPEAERDALRAAVSLLAAAHGPRDVRLAEPLRAIAASAVQSRSDEAGARAALEQALALDYPATRDGVLARAAALATRGDLEAVFRVPGAGNGWYRQAWDVVAASPLAGADLARRTFARPVPIRVTVPDAPFRSRRGNLEHFAAGTVAFAFTVSADGTIEDLRLQRSDAPMDSVPDPVLRAFRQARYRPRLVGGEPVATPDHGFELRFRQDATRSPRPVTVGPVDQQR